MDCALWICLNFLSHPPFKKSRINCRPVWPVSQKLKQLFTTKSLKKQCSPREKQAGIVFPPVRQPFNCSPHPPAVILLFLTDVENFLIITLLIGINGTIGSLQELKAESTIESLKRMTRNRNRAIRNWDMKIIAPSSLVPWDRVVIEEGDLIWADLRLFETYAMIIDESPLTGESLPVEKDHSGSVP